MSRSSGNSSSSSGIGFFGLLQVALIVLKLCKLVTFSWWVVFLPLWIELLIVVIIFILLWLANN